MSRIASLAKTNRKEFTRFSKFLAVGVTGFVVDFGVFNLLFKALNFPPVLAQAISFTLAAINNFLWNRYWTYPDSRSKPILRQFGMFFVLSVIGLLIRTPIFAFFSGPMVTLVESMQYGLFGGLINFVTNTLHISLEQLGLNLALAVAVLVVLFWNFFSNRFITYSDVKFGK
ncbi:MAG TPA: GtrA family protein [Anaerolineae bacterium]|nr:GtrA family protein [Anaerolineae bacterium]